MVSGAEVEDRVARTEPGIPAGAPGPRAEPLPAAAGGAGTEHRGERAPGPGSRRPRRERGSVRPGPRRAAGAGSAAAAPTEEASHPCRDRRALLRARLPWAAPAAEPERVSVPSAPSPAASRSSPGAGEPASACSGTRR